jgi:hypothetical protein
MFFNTVLSVAAACFLFFYPSFIGMPVDLTPLAMFMLALSSFFFFLFVYLRASAWNGLQKAEKHFSSGILELFRKDKRIRILSFSLSFVPLLMLFLSIMLYASDKIDKMKLIAIWVVLVGVVIDLIYNLMQRIQSFLNPYQAVAILSHAAKISIQNEHERDLCASIDSMAEASIKAIAQSSLLLANEAINELQILVKVFLESLKSIGYQEQDRESLSMGITDRARFTLFYVFQRLELINEQAIKRSLEPVCSNIVSALGKITLNAAKSDISLAAYPLHYLGKCAIRSQKKHLHEVAVKASLTLFEVAKRLPVEINPEYLEIKEAYFSLITQLHEIAKETFKEDKATRIDLLVQPFREIKEIFKGEKLAHHPDTPAILSKIEGVLAEFDILEMVMKTLPPLPEFSEPQTPPPLQTPPETPPA